MSAAKVKARKMWGVGKGVFAYKGNATVTAKKWNGEVTPLAVLPTNDESIESMIEQMARANAENDGIVITAYDVASARIMLASIGIHSRAPKS
jgi:hypothetical protein